MSLYETYELHAEWLNFFFREFENKTSIGLHNEKKYLNILQNISDGDETLFQVDVDDLQDFFQEPEKNKNLIQSVVLNTKRYEVIIYYIAEQIRTETTPPTKITRNQNANMINIPIELKCIFTVKINLSKFSDSITIGNCDASTVGSLVKVDVVVLKVMPVRPKIQVAAYICVDCNELSYQGVENISYMPVTECLSSVCSQNRSKGDIKLSFKDSRFIRYQELRLQEAPHHVHSGDIPMTIKAIIEGEDTRELLPGMACTLSAIVLPQSQDLGMYKRGDPWLTDIYLEIQTIEIHKKGFLTNKDLLIQDFQDPDLYSKMAASIAPSIYGLDDVKKILLMQLIGGVSKDFNDGMKVRGDIHVLLMGDPGIAKSQLLKQICHIAPRAYYTTSQGSSGVGLTASVSKDSSTGEFCLEAGAIVLADNGICCIDEFDKMDEYDRTCIHEVMEQQTVSIAKAGLTASLNARTSILAAANPVEGRYVTTKTPIENINLPAALLSRFDIQYILLDKPSVNHDKQLAEFIIGLNQVEKTYYDNHQMRLLISKAQTFEPLIIPELVQMISDYYVNIREEERNVDTSCFYTTPRTLLTIIRLSQAHAKLRGSNLVELQDFEEGTRLMKSCKQSISTSLLEKQNQVKKDYKVEIIDMLKYIDKMRFVNNQSRNLNIKEIESDMINKGFTSTQYKSTIEEYLELNVLIKLDQDYIKFL